MYKLSEVSQLKYGPLKALSQNFLIDLNIINKIVDTLGAVENKRVLEIGPGVGALSEILVERGALLTAIEKDKRVIPLLRQRMPSATIIEGDAMEEPFPETDFIISNLPYQLTSPLLGRFLPLNIPMTLMMQDEVARRVVGKISTKDYSPLTLFCNYYATPKFAFKVKASSFYPRPKVESAVLTFTPKHAPPMQGLMEVVQKAFSQRRKMVRNSFPEVILQEAGIDPTMRPENISLESFLKLAQLLQNKEDKPST